MSRKSCTKKKKKKIRNFQVNKRIAVNSMTYLMVNAKFDICKHYYFVTFQEKGLLS